MNQLLTWTLDTIRSDGAMMSWLEERRFEWVPLVSDAVSRLMGGATVILLTDNERQWFARYATSTMNKPERDRPMLPVFEADCVLPYLDRLGGGEETDLVLDMLSVAYGEEFIFWYVGKSSYFGATIAKEYRSSFLWMMDEEVQNSFFLRSGDELLDLKLLHMVRLFDKTLDAVMVGDIEL